MKTETHARMIAPIHIESAAALLIDEARRLHNAPDEPAHSFSFIVAPDGKSMNVFLRWTGANIPFPTKEQIAKETARYIGANKLAEG